MARGYHHGDLREALIALALNEIDRQDPDRLSISALAKRARVSPMAPYRHFADREALLTAVAVRGFERLAAAMRQADAPDPAQAIVAFGVCYVEFAMAHPGLFRLMFAGQPPTSDRGLANNASTAFGLFAARIADLVPAPCREDAFLACWSLVHGLASLCSSGRIRGQKAAPEDVARRLGSLAVKALTCLE